MTTSQIAADVERGIAVRSQIKKLQAELKLIEGRLEQAGLHGDQVPLQDEDREGRQFLAFSEAHVVPVIFESDQLIASFTAGTPAHETISALAGEHLKKFYAVDKKFSRVPKDGQAFRRLAREQFGTAAPEFIAACVARDKNGIGKSRTIIGWDNVRNADEVATA